MDTGIGIMSRDYRISTPALHHRLGTPAHGARLATPAPCRISSMSSSYGASVANRLLSPMVCLDSRAPSLALPSVAPFSFPIPQPAPGGARRRKASARPRHAHTGLDQGYADKERGVLSNYQ